MEDEEGEEQEEEGGRNGGRESVANFGSRLDRLVMPKTPSVKLTDDDAWCLFNDSIDTRNVDDVWKYSRGDVRSWKKSIRWSEVRKSRQSLNDIFRMSGGFQLTHKPFLAQLTTWADEKKKKWSAVDIERSVYRLRCMMAHLRDYRRAQFRDPSKKPPLGYENLLSLLANVRADGPKPTDGECDDSEETDDDSVVACSASETEVVDLTGDISATTTPATATSSGGLDEKLADLEKDLFKSTVITKCSVTTGIVAPPVHRRIAVKSRVEPRQPSADIEGLLALSEKVRAPTPAEVQARAKAKAKEKAMRTPRTAKGKAKGKAKAMKAKKTKVKGTGKREHEKVAGGDLPVEWQSVIDKHSPKNNPDVDFYVLIKRAHSKIYHGQRDAFSHTVPLPEAKRLASEAAVRVTRAMRAQFA